MIDGTTQAASIGNTNPAGPEVFFDVVDLDTFPSNPGKLFTSRHCFAFAGASNNSLSGFGFVDSSPSAMKSTGGVIGLVANSGFPGLPTKGNMIFNNWLGLSSDGESYAGLRFGIYLAFNSQENVVEKNVICTGGIDLLIDFFLNGLQSQYQLTQKNQVRGNYLGTNAPGTKRLAPTTFNRRTDGLGNPSLSISYATIGNIIENNIIAGTKSGGIGAINPGEGDLITGANSNVIRNNRIGIGANGENIGPDPTDSENARAVGIFASAGDMVTGNLIGNFPGTGIAVRTAQKPDSSNPFGPTAVTGNMISNCGIGIQ
ncbi:MAG TPA: hypothetical protein PLB32_16145, partial [Acidobacteriota bacterium]|nr:hypothetical protein [Acidobacteriota bacterium]